MDLDPQITVLISMMTHRLEVLERNINDVRTLIQDTREHQLLLSPEITALRAKLEDHSKAIAIIDSLVITRKTLKFTFGVLVSTVGAIMFFAATFDQIKRWLSLFVMRP